MKIYKRESGMIAAIGEDICFRFTGQPEIQWMPMPPGFGRAVMRDGTEITPEQLAQEHPGATIDGLEG